MTDNQYCTFYIVRHGETVWNVQKKLQGQSDSPLTVTGKSQARNLAEKLKAIHFDAVFSSDLLRAKRTAKILIAERELAIETKELLRERAFGKYEGKAFEEHRVQLKDKIDEYEKLADKDKFTFKYADDMESDEEIVTRLNLFIREVALSYRGKTVMVVTHGSIMRAFLIHLGFGNYQDMRSGVIKNTAYVKLLSDGVDFFIKETYGVEKIKI